MELDVFIAKLDAKPNEVTFQNTMDVIEQNFDFVPTAFQNGDIQNEAGQNSGSCKLFALAQDQGFAVEQTLACFGDYYREEVLKQPDGKGHQNIRNFMKYGWQGITFEGKALTRKK